MRAAAGLGLLLLQACVLDAPLDDPSSEPWPDVDDDDSAEPEPEPEPEPSADDDDSAPQPAAIPLPAVGPMLCEAAPHGLNVTWLGEWTGERDCEDQLKCTLPYERLAADPAFTNQLIPLSTCEETLEGWREIHAEGQDHGWPEVELLADVDLGEEILRRTQLGFLMDEERLWDRPLEVAVLEATERESWTGAAYWEKRLLLIDPLLGQIEVLHLVPAGRTDPIPTVVVLPGHDEDVEQHRDLRYAQYLPEHGFGALIVGFRAWAQPWDDAASSAVLCTGTSLMALRAYEVLVAMKYLLVAPEACGAPLATLGHSGGSLTGNLLAWIPSNPAVAHVSDFQSYYRSFLWTEDDDVLIDCETNPGLFALHDAINARTDPPRPQLDVPYGYALADDPWNTDPDPEDLRAMEWWLPFLREVLEVEGG